MALTLTTRRLTTRLSPPARDFAHWLAGRAGRQAGALASAASAAARAEAAACAPATAWAGVPMQAQAPAAPAMAALAARHRDCARAGRWDGLLSALTTADATRATAPDGSRLAVLISTAARADVTAALTAGDLTAAALAAQRLDEMARARPASHAAADLVARARLDLAAAHRAAALSGDADPAHPAAARAETAEVARLVDAFDPIERNSPLLAATRYALVGTLEEAEPLWHDWYEDWIDLDPLDPAPHLAHALHLLPHWFGTLAGFDAAARRAAARTADVTGAAAYALHYLAAHEALGRMPPGLDEALFFRGLDDHCRAQPGQEDANRIAAVLAERLHNLGGGTLPEPASAARTRAALTRHLRRHLSAFHLSAWAEGETCVRWVLSQCFGAEIAAGARIEAASRGLTLRWF